MNAFNTLKFVLWFVAAVVVMVSTGCEKAGELSELSQGQPQYANEGLGDILRLINDGDKVAAVEAFVAADPESLLSGSTVPVLGVSEAQFGRLSRAQRNTTQDSMLQFVSDVKTLARACAAHAEKAGSEGDHSKARDHLDAIGRLGERLRDGDYLIPIQQTGMALVSLSEPQATEVN